MSAFFNARNLSFRYEPFPIGHMTPMVDAALYQEMVDNRPSQSLFEFLPRLGNKYSLLETCHAAQYREVLRTIPIWTRFDQWITGSDFVREVMETLQQHHIDLGYRPGVSWAKQTLKNIKTVFRGRSSHRGARYRATWEFQMMPSQGGHLLPHSDAPSKIVTMTLAILNDNEWDPAWGGGIDINRPKNNRHAYNQLNQQAAFDDMDVIDTVGFAPNTGVIFIKTFNSWHSVRPMQGTDATRMRKNLVINIKSE